MNQHQPVIAVDLDDTCADRTSVLADLLRAEGVAVPERKPATWALTDWGVRDKTHRDRLHHDAFVRGSGY